MNKTTLRKLKENGANETAFIFEPDNVKKVNQTWRKQDFELDQAQLLDHGKVASKLRDQFRQRA